MRRRFVMVMFAAAVGACSPTETDDLHYSVFFQPYSAVLDLQGQTAVHDAAEAAKSNLVLPIKVVGFAAPPDPSQDIDGLSAQRAAVVQKALVAEGVSPLRIVMAAKGTTDPKDLPNLAVRRVDISIGR